MYIKICLNLLNGPERSSGVLTLGIDSNFEVLRFPLIIALSFHFPARSRKKFLKNLDASSIFRLSQTDLVNLDFTCALFVISNKVIFITAGSKSSVLNTI